MGIHGIYKEIGPGQRIALSKLAVDKFEQTGRPLRIAVDISIWLFQIQSSKGGSNPALRTFYYRLLRLISLSIHPLFVFDGPNKPPFKRNKRTGPNVASIPEFLAKQLLKQFGLVFHIAPGEAEAECALLQREGIVDAVLSEDVDTLMFGSGVTLRNWSSEVSKGKTPTHVNLYDAKETKTGSKMDREGMILVALMSGGDYIPEGIPGCGPKIACEAARAGFGAELCKISKKDSTSMGIWRERLGYELRSNESKFFRTKHGKLTIPDDFPNPEVLGYYTNPVISPPEKIERLRQSLKWDQELNFGELRTFTGEAFDWTKLGGAKKFIRNLAPALLVKELRMRGQEQDQNSSDDIEATEEQEARLVKGIHGSRNHATTDGVAELRISFIPHELVPIDLDAEEPDDEYPVEADSEDEEPVVRDEAEAPTSPSKKRAPSAYDPTKPEKVWIFETYVKVGVPLKAEDWEATIRAKQNALDLKAAKKVVPRTTKGKKKAANGHLDRFATVIKPGQTLRASQPTPKDSSTSFTMVVGTEPLGESNSQGRPQPAFTTTFKPVPRPKSKPSSNLALKPVSKVPSAQATVIDLSSSSPPLPSQRLDRVPSLSTSFEHNLPPTVTKRRRSPLKRTQTDSVLLNLRKNFPELTNTPSARHNLTIPASPSPLPSPSQLMPTKRAKKPGPKVPRPREPSTPSRQKEIDTVDIFLSPRQTDITSYFTPSKRRDSGDGKKYTQKPSRRSPSASRIIEELDLTASSPTKPHRRPPLTLSDLERQVRIQPRPARNQSFSLSTPSLPSTTHSRSRESMSKSCEVPQEPLARLSPPPISQISAEVDLIESPPRLSILKSNPPACRPASSRPSRRATSKVSKAPQSSLRRSPRTLTQMRPPVIIERRKVKEVIRVRKSLEGAFEIEEIDLSEDVAVKTLKAGKSTFRMSEVGFLDLTGD